MLPFWHHTPYLSGSDVPFAETWFGARDAQAQGSVRVQGSPVCGGGSPEWNASKNFCHASHSACGRSLDVEQLVTYSHFSAHLPAGPAAKHSQ